ncbi:MAG: hypothetical protein GY898_05375 [Proteobacteria bacterium]|nr:hypothetical protein [Pseudomonadota bacterium]
MTKESNRASIIPHPRAQKPLTGLRWAPSPRGATRDDVRAAFNDLARQLAEGQLLVLQERLYVEPYDVDEVLAIRRDALQAHGLDADRPFTIVSNKSCIPGICVGVHMLALRPAPGESIRTVRAGPATGRLLESGSTTALFVSDVAASPGSVDPLHEMFAGAVAACAEHGMTLRDVARTWLYVENLIPTYDHLNRVRDEVFLAEGLKDDSKWLQEPPASTGIQAWHPDRADCFLDLIAVTRPGADRPFTGVTPDMQCEAWDYGSSFSRGMTIDLGRRRLVTISGTASIGGDGLTMHLDDPAAQILETMRNIDSLLELGKADPARGLWTLYFKDEQVWDAWQDLVLAGELRAPPQAAAVFGDVCRDNLLFEAEVTVPL